MNAAHSKVRRHYDEVADIYDSRYDRNRGKYSNTSREA